MQTITKTINGRCLGTTHQLVAYRFGQAGQGPSFHIQGGLHADEGPGMLVARTLCDRLEALESAGLLAGQVTIVPAANPIGLSQFALGQQEGRFDIYDGRNFNRHYPDLGADAINRLAGQLGSDARQNISTIRWALADALAACRPDTPSGELRKELLGLALDADFVLDLHCDGEAEVHLYTQIAAEADLEPLAWFLGARAVLLAEISGDNPFDESLARPWLDIARAFPDCPVPLACRSTTVELRGRLDVDRHLADCDAQAILSFMRLTGTVAGEQPEVPAPSCKPTPLAGSQALSAPRPGLLTYVRQLGEMIRIGETVAEITDPLTGLVTPVKAMTDGIFYARADTRIAETGKRLGKIAGSVPFRSGLLLSP